MRLSPTTLAVLVTALLPITQAYVFSLKTLEDDGSMDAYLYDNPGQVCYWIGKYVGNRQQFMTCLPGYASWIQIPFTNNPPNGVQAYAYGGQNFKWAMNAKRYNGGWKYVECLFGCPPDLQKTLNGMVWNETETADEMAAKIRSLIDKRTAKEFTA